MLIETHEAAVLKGKLPDMQRFFELVRLKAQVRNCTGEKLLADKTWHVMSKLPQFTVCEECYSAVVWPAIEAGSSVAGRLNRTPQRVHEKEDENGVVGTSCQLYSPRAQRVFQNAVQTADSDYLAQRARKRKRKEIARAAALSRLALEMRSAWQYETRRQIIDSIQVERERIKSEWKDWE